MFYIYGLADPTTKIIRYVGQTVEPKYRLRGHISEARKSKLDRKNKWIRSLLNKGQIPEMYILEILDTQDSCNIAEKFHITQLKDCGFDLVNFLDGGTNPPNLKGESATNSKLKEKDVVYIRQQLNSGYKTLTQIHQEYPNMTKQCIHLAATGNSWAHVKEPVFEPRKKVKLTSDNILEIKYLLKIGQLNQTQIAKQFKVDPATISNIKRGKRRNNIQ